MKYTSTLPYLPDVPVIVLTSLKPEAYVVYGDSKYGAGRQIWYNASEQSGRGVTDFTHITATNSGHYIMRDEPELVIYSIDLLMSKLS
jgi:hypothetical protein